jgi:hypothetical protein
MGKIEIFYYYMMLNKEIIMSTTRHYNNMCFTCKKCVFDGIIRNSHFYCSISCYNLTITGGWQLMQSQPIPIPIQKKCDYCSSIINTNINTGIQHGPNWYCSHNHFNLANRQPRIIIGGPMVIPVQQIQYRLPVYGGYIPNGFLPF